MNDEILGDYIARVNAKIKALPCFKMTPMGSGHHFWHSTEIFDAAQTRASEWGWEICPKCGLVRVHTTTFGHDTNGEIVGYLHASKEEMIRAIEIAAERTQSK